MIWGDQTVAVDGSVILLEGLGKAGEEQVTQISLQFLLSSHPHLTTAIKCLTDTRDSQVIGSVSSLYVHVKVKN